MNKIVKNIAALGVPGLMLLVEMSATGLSGAAAVTAALSSLGPGGMIGGIVFLGAVGLISQGLTEYGFDQIFVNVIKELYKKGETKESILQKIEKYPVSKSLKRKLKEELYCMKTQIFNDGNKRAAVIFANHYLISKGEGFIAIPEEDVPEFKRLLVGYYEDKDNGEIIDFMKTKCWKTF